MKTGCRSATPTLLPFLAERWPLYTPEDVCRNRRMTRRRNRSRCVVRVSLAHAGKWIRKGGSAMLPARCQTSTRNASSTATGRAPMKTTNVTSGWNAIEMSSSRGSPGNNCTCDDRLVTFSPVTGRTASFFYAYPSGADSLPCKAAKPTASPLSALQTSLVFTCRRRFFLFPRGTGYEL